MAVGPLPDVLPLVEWAAGRVVFRVHRIEHDPLYFGPAAGMSSSGRFDPPDSARYRVLYAGEVAKVALVETLLRNPKRQIVALADVVARQLSRISFPERLRLVDLTGPGLQLVGATAEITAGAHSLSRPWGEALFSHAAKPDGILYRSRHDPEQKCLAIFDRQARPGPRVEDYVRLESRIDRVSAVLLEYGKFIDFVPDNPGPAVGEDWFAEE